MTKLHEEKDPFTRTKKKRHLGVLSCGNLNKITNEPKLNKYIEITINRFAAKCSFLIKQIQEMKSDFVSQLEGINALFSLKQNQKTISINTSKKKLAKSSIRDKMSNLNEGQFSKQIYLNTAPSSTKVHKQAKDTNKEHSTSLYENDSNRKLSMQRIQTNEESMKLKIDYQESNKINVTKTRMKDKVSNKVKALMLICNSDILCFEEKMRIKGLNRQLHQEKSLQEVLLASKAFLEESKKKKEAAKFIDLPSNTCQSSLNFIKKENENDLKDMTNEYNKAFFSLIYILFGEKIPNSISYEHLYESILRKNQAQSIKTLFLNVILKKAVETPSHYPNSIIDKFNAVTDKYPELISRDALLNANKSLFLFSFCLKELKLFFEYEKSKRNEIERLNCCLNNLNFCRKATK